MSSPTSTRSAIERPTRRAVAAGLAVVGVTGVLPPAAVAQIPRNDIDLRIKSLVGDAVVKSGGIRIEMPQLAENGNLVQVTISVDGGTAGGDRAVSIHLFAEKNPVAQIAAIRFGPRAGDARLQTNVRLATSQQVTAIARMADGSFRSGKADVVVTLAACIDAG